MRPGAVLFAAGLLAAIPLAAALRLPRLEDRPMHGDEANQAWKAAALAGLVPGESGYRYDPEEHHGPSLYYCTLPALWIARPADFAATDEAMFRVVPALFGVGLVLLVVLVADGLGRGAAALAGALTAVSPALVFYSRYYVQETLLVCFTFAATGCAWRWFRGGAWGWAAAAGAFLGLMHATKETWVLAAAAMAGAALLTALWSRWRDGAWPARARRMGPAAACLVAAAAFCAVAVAFYSSFGTNVAGPVDSVLAFTLYLRRGAAPVEHGNPPLFYLERLLAFRAKGGFWSEGLIAGLAAIGATCSLLPREKARAVGGVSDRNPPSPPTPLPLAGEGSGAILPSPFGRGGGGEGSTLVFCRFLAFYTVLLTAIYSAIPYKTPWCAIGFLHGMILLAGAGGWWLLGIGPAALPRPLAWPARAVVFWLLAAGLGHLAWQARELSFNNRLYADPDRNPWVYAHTATNVLELAARMEELAAVSPEGHAMTVHVVVPENYWPLPWYLRRFERVGFWQEAGRWAEDTRGREPPSAIILSPDAAEAVDARLPASYNQQMLFRLRPEVFLRVYVREDVWEAFLASVADRK